MNFLQCGLPNLVKWYNLEALNQTFERRNATTSVALLHTVPCILLSPLQERRNVLTMKLAQNQLKLCDIELWD